MRILHYSRYFPFPVAYELAIQQINLGHQVTVACWPGISKMPKGSSVYNGVKVNCYGIDIYSNPVRFKLAPFKILRIMNDFISLTKILRSFDIIHVHGPTFYIYPKLYSKFGIYEWGVSKHLAGIPSVWTFHGHTGLLTKYRAALINEIKSSDICTSVNKKVADELKIMYIPNGVNTNIFKPISPKPERKKFGVPEDKVVLLYIGRWIPRKGQDIFVNCLKKLDTLSLKKIYVMFIGPTDSGHYNYLKNTLNELRKINVDFNVASVPTNLIPIIYNLADIFCFTSKDEGHPLVLLEALASGLPILVLKGNYPINFNNILLANNINEFADQLSRLIHHENLRKEIGTRAREEALSYEWAIINQQYMSLYLKLL